MIFTPKTVSIVVKIIETLAGDKILQTNRKEINTGYIEKHVESIENHIGNKENIFVNIENTTISKESASDRAEKTIIQ